MPTDDRPGLNLARLLSHLDRAAPGLVRGRLTADLLPGGRSNLTCLPADDAQKWVLRWPPLGHVPATAHDMARAIQSRYLAGQTVGAGFDQVGASVAPLDRDTARAAFR